MTFTISPVEFSLELGDAAQLSGADGGEVLRVGKKRTTHLSPAHSWKSMGPMVESCVKLGAVSPR